jgi:Pectate lyase superfamily protein
MTDPQTAGRDARRHAGRRSVLSGAAAGLVAAAGAIAVGAGSPAAAATGSATPAWYNVTAYGAVGDGTTDDTAAIQQAITAAATNATTGSYSGNLCGTVYVPAGSYLISSALNIPSTVRITGDGASMASGSIITSTKSAIFTNGYGYLAGGCEVDHLTLSASGGHIFTGLNCNTGGSFHDLLLIQNSADYSVWDHDGSQPGAGLFGSTWRDIQCIVYGAARTVPAWNFRSLGDETFAGNTFENINVTAADSDELQYVFYVASAAGQNAKQSHLVFRDCQFGQCGGGSIALYSVMGCIIDNCNSDNLDNPPVLQQSAFYLGTSSNYASKGVTFLKCSRETSNINTATAWDIQLEASVSDVTIIGYAIGASASFTPYLNLGSASHVVLVGCAANTVITNLPADLVVIGAGTISGNAAGTGLYPPEPAADWNGFLAWNADLGVIGTNSAQATAGTMYLMKLFLRQPCIITKINWIHAVAGSGAAAGKNFVGLYSSAGTLLASAAIDAEVAGSNLQSATISAGLQPAGVYYVAYLVNASTMPKPLNGTPNGTYANAGVSGAALRWSVKGTGKTALPATVTVSSNTANGCESYWVALS